MEITRLTPPSGDGQVLIEPVLDAWPELLAANDASFGSWRFEVAGVPLPQFRARCRAEALEAAREFSTGIGLSVSRDIARDAPLVVTGHQPDLYHPGVWLKNFLLQRFSDTTGAAAVNIVVDTDTYASVELAVPCFDVRVGKCREPLAIGAPGRCYACTPVPDGERIGRFIDGGRQALEALGAREPLESFLGFSRELADAAQSASSLSELLTIARRRFERSAGTDYLELPVSRLAHTGGWLEFVVHIACRARAFAECVNAELAEYRRIAKSRSATEPFPDLGVEHDLIETPFWVLDGSVRHPLWVREQGGAVELLSDGAVIGVLGGEADRSSLQLQPGVIIAPRAIALTMFTRMFIADLFIHGIGGARYDAVTDAVCRRFWGVEPPRFVAASMSLRLPIAVDTVSDEQMAAAKDRLHRLDHNPDALLGKLDLGGEARDRLTALAAEKRELVSAIAQPDADKKSIGLRIKELNAEMTAALLPVKEAWTAELAELEHKRAIADAAGDRTYPFCLWTAGQVAAYAR